MFAKFCISSILSCIEFRCHIAAATPALITYSPERDVPGLIPAILPAQVCQRALCIKVEIFQPVSHFFRSTRAYITGDIRLTAQQAAKLQEFMRTETIIFCDHTPGRIDGPFTLLPGADSILPMVLIGITSSRPAQYGHFYLFQRIYYVHPYFISRPESVIDTSPQVFREMAIYIAADHRSGSISDRKTYCRLRGREQANTQQERQKEDASAYAVNFQFHEHLIVFSIIKCHEDNYYWLNKKIFSQFNHFLSVAPGPYLHPDEIGACRKISRR